MAYGSQLHYLGGYEPDETGREGITSTNGKMLSFLSGKNTQPLGCKNISLINSPGLNSFNQEEQSQTPS